MKAWLILGLSGLFAATAVMFMAVSSAHAGTVCTDLDGDGTAETCVEVDDDGAHFPGEEPPEVPPVGESGPVGPSDGDDGGDTDGGD